MTIHRDDFEFDREDLYLDEAEALGGEPEGLEEAPRSPRKKKKRRKKHYFLRFLVFLALIYGLYYFITSDFFNIRTIQVSGNYHYTSQEVIEKSGVELGINLFTLDASRVKETVLKDPYVKAVYLKRIIPGTIRITVREREAAAGIPYGTTYILIDSQGVVLEKVDYSPELTILVGMTIRNMEPGKVIDVEEGSLLQETLVLLESMDASDVFFKKIDISDVIVKAYIDDRLICRGSPGDILVNLENGNLKSVLYDLYTKGTERGIIHVSGDKYCSFSPLVN